MQKASHTEDICFSSLRRSFEMPQAAEEICRTFEASDIVLACTMRSAGLCNCQCEFVGARMKACDAGTSLDDLPTKNQGGDQDLRQR